MSKIWGPFIDCIQDLNVSDFWWVWIPCSHVLYLQMITSQIPKEISVLCCSQITVFVFYICAIHVTLNSFISMNIVENGVTLKKKLKWHHFQEKVVASTVVTSVTTVEWHQANTRSRPIFPTYIFGVCFWPKCLLSFQTSPNPDLELGHRGRKLVQAAAKKLWNSLL